MCHLLPVEAPGHAQMDEKVETALETQEQVLAAPLDRDHPISLELLDDLEEVVRPRQARVVDLDTNQRPPLEPRRELRPDRLDLGKLGHDRYSTTSRRMPRAGGASSPIS